MSHPSAARHGPGRRLPRRLLVAAALLLGVIGGAFFALRAGVRLVERQVTAALGPGSQIGSLRAGWNDVEITDLRISAPDGWPEPDSLRAERVQIVPSWRSLLSERIWIARVEVSGAFLSALRTRDGKLRVLPTLVEGRDAPGAPAQPTPSGNATPDAAPVPAPTRTVSIGELRIANGTLELFDASVANPPSRLHLQQIDATLQDVVAPGLAGQMPFDIEAVLDGPQRDGRVALSGWLDASTRDLELTGSLRAVDLLALQPYFLERKGTRFAGGALDLDIEAQVRSRRLHAPGRLTLSQLRFASGRRRQRDDSRRPARSGAEDPAGEGRRNRPSTSRSTATSTTRSSRSTKCSRRASPCNSRRSWASASADSSKESAAWDSKGSRAPARLRVGSARRCAS